MTDRPLHVALVTPAYPPLKGGGERYVGALAGELAALGARGSFFTGTAAEEAEFWQGASGSSDAVEAGARVIRLPIIPTPGGRAELMRRRRWMVLLSALPGDQSVSLSRLARRFPPV